MKKTILIIIALIIFLSAGLIIESLLNPVKKGNGYYKAGKWKEAERAYLSAQRYRPDSYIINYNLGNIYFKKGDYDKAISYFQKAVEKEKGFFEGYYNLGTAYIKKGATNEALYYLEKARELRSDDEDLTANIRYIQSVRDREKAKGEEGDAKTALQPEYTGEAKQMDSDEGGAVVTGEGMEAILRMHKGEEERWQGAFRLDIEGASKKGQQDGIEGVWQKDW
ncbi:MAG: tetratricopeptide repeat protein [Nitrospirae bacterium]|nr:tetratricopeptide repeat protein [Nitrospirota bacterium]